MLSSTAFTPTITGGGGGVKFDDLAPIDIVSKGRCAEGSEMHCVIHRITNPTLGLTTVNFTHSTFSK